MASRTYYWSCSGFADWLRGTTKPSAETGQGWRDWRRLAKSTYPVRYWLAEEGLDHVQKFVYWIPDQLYAIKYYINNRWISRTHSLTAHPRDIRPGDWQDVGNRFLPCLFNELVDFVELELAWWHLVWEGKEKRARYNAPWWRFGWWNIRIWRCAQAGIDNLEWQAGLVQDKDWGLEETDPEFGKPTSQAQNALEILELYRWWTVTRLARPEPMKVSGWSDYCDRQRVANLDDWIFSDREDKEDTSAMLDEMHRLEAEYEAEDEAMMIRLIRVRNALWT
jgi:hypothetical protein